jgi:phenylalanine-4-hydroxylase
MPGEKQIAPGTCFLNLDYSSLQFKKIMEMNEVLEKLPIHLFDLVIDQPYDDYTSQDQALWRYVMRQNVRFLSKVAHSSYVDGLKKTGISLDEIPHMFGMNRILKEIGWSAVAVDGFIPPAAFMEFQAYNILVIAADIRPINQIRYTPAPDIIHEAAGHAPIIADPEYADYLRLFGEIGCKALSSDKDYKLYEAIRHLSILKADPYTPAEKINQAEADLAWLEKNLGEPSEMALIRNLHWWTVEYGLIGSLDNPKIYGAGLLSSIGESYNCLQPHVKKLPLNSETIHYSFDITTQQPQLFVTPDFAHLTKVLNEFADTMALRKGGFEGIQKAIRSKNLATAVWSSGLQLSGIFTEVLADNNFAVYIKTTGPSSLNFNNRQIEGHEKDYHKHGYGSPVGNFKGIKQNPEDLTHTDLDKYGIRTGEKTRIEFESGVLVSGVPQQFHFQNNKLLFITFSDCSVEYKGEVLFQPEWGNYDMAVGQFVCSVYSGVADPVSFGFRFAVPTEKTHKIEHGAQAQNLHRLYSKVREIRTNNSGFEELNGIWNTLKINHPDDWLLALEILEILELHNIYPEIKFEITEYLNQFSSISEDFRILIYDGIQAIEELKQ